MDSEKAPMGSDLSQATGGYEIVLSGVIFALAGLWLDRRFGTTPLFIIVLSVLGFTGSVLNVYYKYRNEIAKIEAETEALRKGQRPQ